MSCNPQCASAAASVHETDECVNWSPRTDDVQSCHASSHSKRTQRPAPLLHIFYLRRQTSSYRHYLPAKNQNQPTCKVPAVRTQDAGSPWGGHHLQPHFGHSGYLARTTDEYIRAAPPHHAVAT